MKYIRVYSDNFDGHIFTEQAFNILKGQLCNGDSTQFDTKEISLVEIGDNERVHDVSDLKAMGYSVPDTINEDAEVELTEQSDDGLFEEDTDDEAIDAIFSEMGEEDEDDDSEEGYF